MFLEQISILEWFSQGSCDTEDWSNDAENSSLASHEKNYTLKYIKHIRQFIDLCFLLYFWSINSAFVSKETLENIKL